MHHSPGSAPVPPANPADAVISGETVCTSGTGTGQRAVPGKGGLSISDAAFARLKTLLVARATPGAGLRVAVKGGGCAGLSYALSWDEGPVERDRVFEREGVRVFVDPKSYIYLVGSVLEYEDKLLQAGFKLLNPQARSSCGCGESFSA